MDHLTDDVSTSALHDAPSLLSGLDWVHVFPLGVGGVAPDHRPPRFNGVELIPLPFSRSHGLFWCGAGRSCVVPGMADWRPTGGTVGMYHAIGLRQEGVPTSGHVAVVDDPHAAVRCIRRCSTTRRNGRFLVAEWSLALVSIDSAVGVAIDFRAPSGDAELEVRRVVADEAGLRAVMKFPRRLLRNVAPMAGEEEGDLTVTSADGGYGGVLRGSAYEATLAPSSVLLELLESSNHS